MLTPLSWLSSFLLSARRWVSPTPSSRARPVSELSSTRRLVLNCYQINIEKASEKKKLTWLQTAAVLALTEVRSEDKNELSKLVSAVKDGYMEKHEQARRQWGGGI